MNINNYIDHTNLKAYATYEEINQLIDEAKYYEFKAICINPFFVPYAKAKLDGTNVLVCSVCGFPLGANSIEVKVYEAKQLITYGCDEIDYVLNISALKMHDYDYLRKEMQALREATFGRVLKVIIETCYLTEEEMIKVSKMVSEIGVDFVKTSTGFGGAGARSIDVELICKNIAPNICCKASGGIRDLATFEEMLKAGAMRIGTSNGVSIMKEAENV